MMPGVADFSGSKIPKYGLFLTLLVAGAFALIWILFPQWKEFSGASMKFNTCLGFILASIACLALRPEASPTSFRRRFFGNSAAILVLLLGALTLAQYIFSFPLGIDELFVSDFLSAESRTFPGRMSLMAALCFCFVSLALLALNLDESHRRYPWSVVFLLPVLIVSLLAGVGYLYGVRALYQLGPYIRISWQSAAMFAFVSFSIFLSRPRNGPVALLLSKGAGGTALRRLLPVAIVLPILLGGVRLLGQHYGFYNLEFGTAIHSVASIITFSVLIWLTAKKLELIGDEKKQLAYKFEGVVRNVTVGIGLVDAQGNTVMLNPAAMQLHGFTSQSEIFSTLEDFARDFELRYPDGREMPRADWPVSRAMRGEELSNYDVVLIRKSTGLERYVSYSALPIRDASGRAVNFVFNMVDLTDRRRANELLRKSERQFVEMFNLAPFAIALVKWPSGIIADVNQTWVRLYGYSREEAIGRTSADLGWYQKPEEREVLFDKFMAEGRLRNYEVGIFTRSGDLRVVSHNMDFMELSGEMYAMATLDDITERKIAEVAIRESEEKFRQLAEAVPQIVWTARPNGFIDYYNKRWYEYTGLTEGHFGADSWLPALHPDQTEECEKVWRQALSVGEMAVGEYRFRRANGDYRWFLIRALPFRDASGKIIKWVGTATDIDDQKKLLAEQQNALRSRDDFLSIASHELKTPLTTLRLQSQLRQRMYRQKGLAAFDERRLGEMFIGDEKQLNRLNRLIDDMLDISRIRSGRLVLSRGNTALTKLVSDIAERFREQVASAGNALTLDLEPELKAWIDRDRFEQVVVNLLTNALKYAPGKPIKISAERRGDCAELRVCDEGPGIAEENRERIFQRFERAATKNDATGLGLGLYIAKEIVELHRGKIRVESEVGHGSTFIVSVPLIFEGRADQGGTAL